MIILGLDPGSALLGYGAIRVNGERAEYLLSGVINTKSHARFPAKLLHIDDQLHEIVHELRPAAVVVEKAFFGKNADSAFKLGQVRGVCLVNAERNGAVLKEVAAKKVKKLVTGTGSAEKAHVQLVVSQMLQKQDFASFDESDALAVAIAYWRQSQAEQVLQQTGGVRL